MKEPKPKLLFVSNCIPRPDKSSGELRTIRILDMLSEYWSIDFCTGIQSYEKDELEVVSTYINQLTEMGINVLPIARDAFFQAIKNNSYEAAYFNLFWVAEKFLRLFKLTLPGAYTIVDSVDVHFARLETQYNLGEISKAKVLKTKKRELRMYRMADVVIAVSKEDANLLSLHEVRHVFTIPNIVHTVSRIPGERKPIVIFIGSYLWYPNPDGVKWFAQEIWPLVHATVPQAEFLIIGSDPTKDVMRLGEQPGIKVVGYVPETKPYLDMAAVSVAPLRMGGGMKGKVNEAMAHGIPVVATTIGAQGFEVENGKQMYITDNPSEFSSFVISLLQNNELQREIGLAGQQLNAAICSKDAVMRTMKELYNYCLTITPRNSDHKKREPKELTWKNLQLKIHVTIMKINFIIEDIGHGFTLLQRDGMGQFIRRTWMYLKGQRLDHKHPN